jgi:hypothetical protein
MDIFDVFLVPLYLSIFYFFARRTVSANYKDPVYRVYYMKGLNYKFLGTFAFAFIYLFYYKGGDTLEYYYAAKPMIKLLIIDPVWFFKFIVGLYDHYPEYLGVDLSQDAGMYLTRGSATLTTIRIASVLNLLCCNSFIVLTLCFSFISYHFIWRAFRLLVSLYPVLHKQLSYAFLMIPSVIFWGSGIGKDTIMLGAIMLIFYCFYNLFIKKEIRVSYIIFFIVSLYITALIRGFILFTIIPCLMLMSVVYYQRQIRSSVLRFLVGPIILSAGLGASYFFVKSLGDSVESYKIDSLQKKAEGFKSWHSTLNKAEGGANSGYSIGENFSYTPAGVLAHAPIAAAIALFGPFPWQIRSVVMLLSGIESLAFLYFTVKIIFNKRIYKLAGVLFSDPIIVFCIPFTLILAVAIGLTSFNYGALVRYKIPVLPFFALSIILINYHLDKKRA